MCKLIRKLLVVFLVLYFVDIGISATTKEIASENAKNIESLLNGVKENEFVLDTMLLLISTVLVFIMHLGFATLESGLTQRKNTVNILFKNLFIISIGLLTYYYFGFKMHYPGDNWMIGDFFAMGGIANPGKDGQTLAYGNYTYWSDFIFQGMFAATAATIVSGSVAERVKLKSFMIYVVVLVGLFYPWIGSWHWGGGFLAEKKFYDFAGSTVVHAMGGFSALACVILLGARKGKYTKKGIHPILGHNLPLATIGTLLLWFGWFGFNGGSVLTADPNSLSLVFVTTSLSAGAGCIGAIFVSWIVLKKPDLSMSLNGILAGLVGITAGADSVTANSAVLIGLISGVIVVFSILFFDKIRIDDPVGAISVHGICGIWGTVAVALFSSTGKLGVQLLGILCVCGASFVLSFLVFFILKVTIGVRVSAEEEFNGLDIDEHGSPAYHK